MHWTISRKLFLALLVISLVILVMSALFGRLSFQRGFNAYLEAQEAPVIARLARGIAAEYEKNRWDVLRSEPRRWHELLRQSAPGDSGRPQNPERNGPGPRPGPPPPDKDPFRIGDRIGLFDLSGNLIAGRPIPNAGGAYSGTSIVVESSPVAQLRVRRTTNFSSELDIAFDKRQRSSIIWIAVLLLILAWIVSWIMARQFTKPVRALAEGTRAIANADYGKPIAVASNDELGALATDINSLARVLSANRESRRRWLGDINHELRTPLTILTAELQALEDGFRPFNAASVTSLQNEVDRLAQLVDDLYSLSASDEGDLRYFFAEFDVLDLLRERLDGVAHRVNDKGLSLRLHLPEQPIRLTADATRLGQLFTNLLENAIRYTDSPGIIEISCNSRDNQFQFSIQDSAPGVARELHQRIFERLYRVESSRNRRSGGSGLGLSICAAIVEAHGGSIRAEDSDLQGLAIHLQLPLDQKKQPR